MNYDGLFQDINGTVKSHVHKFAYSINPNPNVDEQAHIKP